MKSKGIRVMSIFPSVADTPLAGQGRSYCHTCLSAQLTVVDVNMLLPYCQTCLSAQLTVVVVNVLLPTTFCRECLVSRACITDALGIQHFGVLSC